MAVTPRSSYSAQGNVSSLAVTIASPAVAGDYAIAVVSHGATGITWTPPSGWALLGTVMSTTSQTMAVYGKVLVSGDIGAPSTFTPSAGGKQALVVEVYSGVSSSTPVGGQSQASATSTSATRTTPALACAGRCIEVMSSKGTDPGAWVPPAAFTARGEVHQSGTGSVTVAIADSTTDLNGADAWSLPVATTQYQAMTLWLNPSGGSGSPNAVASVGQQAAVPRLRTSVTNEVNAASVSAVIAAPAQVGDVALAWHTVGISGVTVTPPAGWAQVDDVATTSSQTTHLFVKVLAAGDIGTPRTFTPSTGGKQAVAIVVYSGVLASNPIGDADVVAYSGITSATRLSPASAATGTLIEAAVSKGANPSTWTPPAGFTMHAEVSQAGTGSSVIAVADSTTDLNGSDTWTLATDQPQANVWAVWLNPATADAAAIEPYSTVTLDGSGSTDPDGTITSYVWTQTGGTPTVAIAGSGAVRTFKAPGTLAGTVLTFQLQVTDNAANSDTDTIAVTVLYATERIVEGGVQVPAQMMAVAP